MNTHIKPLVAAALVVAASITSPPADAARVAIGIGVGIPIGGYDAPGYWGPAYVGPGYVYAPPPIVVQAAPRQPVARPPDPIFYPANGQKLAQTESDRQDCNRWATRQQAALTDANVFQRATYACMEGRGYNVK